MSRQNVLEKQFAKKLPAAALEALTTPNAQLHVDSPITAHAAFAFTHIYTNPYPPTWRNATAKRNCHGMSHVSRVAAYVPVLANLYRKHNDPDAQQLSAEDIQLLQIAALFHDGAREDDERDRWDQESATLLYVYLTRTLGISSEKAAMVSEAVANKDYGDDELGGEYQKISESKSGEIIWDAVEQTKSPNKKNIYQKIIHDADCLDIIRARPAFDASFLDFYKDIAETKPTAFKEMAILITEARGLIEDEGDTYGRLNPAKKAEYECTDAFQKIQHDINATTVVMRQLGGDLLSEEQLKAMSFVTDEKPYVEGSELSTENLRAALREGKIFARGIIFPFIHTKKHNESSVALELRKTFRASGIPTQTKKENRAEKSGNPSRSVTMLGHGAVTYARAGFLVFNPTLDQIEKVHGGDANTGTGKKLAPHQSDNEKVQALKKLHFQQQKGGFTTFRDGFSHNEITYHVDHYDAIYYSGDTRVEENGFVSAEKLSCCEIMGKLNAIFLQYEYKAQYYKIKQEFIKRWPEDGETRFVALYGQNDTLPIIKYSGAHNHIELESSETFSEDNIVNLWGNLAEATMRNDLLKENGTGLCNCSINELKINCLYESTRQTDALGRAQSADSNYPPELKARVSKEIETRRIRVLADDKEKLQVRLSQLKENEFDLSLLKKELPALLRHPEILQQYQTQISTIIETELNSPEFGKKITVDMSYFSEKNKLNFSDAAANILNLNDQDPSHYSPDIVLFFALSKKLGLTQTAEKLKEKAVELINNELVTLNCLENKYQRLDVAKKLRTMMHIFDMQNPHKWPYSYVTFLWNLSTLYNEDHDTRFQQFDELYSELVQDAEIHQILKYELLCLEAIPPNNFDEWVERVALRRYLKMDLPSCDELAQGVKQLKTRYGRDYAEAKKDILNLFNTQDEKDAVVTVFLQMIFADIQKDISQIAHAIFRRCMSDIKMLHNHFSEKTKALAMSHVDSTLAMLTPSGWNKLFLSDFTELMINLKLLGMPAPLIVIEKILLKTEDIVNNAYPKDKMNEAIKILQLLPSDLKTRNMLARLKFRVAQVNDQESSAVVGFQLGQFRKNTADITVNDNMNANIAVKKFFSEHPPKSGSFWHGKNLERISLEYIMRHALGENNKGFLGGYSGADTKKVLQDDYGIKFDKKFLAMSIDEKVSVVSKTINDAPRKCSPEKSIEAQGPKDSQKP